MSTSTLLTSVLSSALATTTAPSSTSSTTTSTSSATQSCVSMTPGKNGYVPEYACNANYNYNPSFAAALVFSILFFITTALHVFQAFKYHKKFCWVIIMGALWELISFVLRSIGSRFQQAQQYAYLSQIFQLLAPLWVNAFCYMVLGRMVYFFIPEKAVGGIKAIRMAKIFVLLDILSFITQLVGGVMISPGASTSILMLGIHIYMGGIGMQQFFILIFTGFAIMFHVRMVRLENEGRLDTVMFADGASRRKWKILLVGLYTCLTLISIRIIYRLIEYASGIDPSKNPIPFHEVYPDVLDALPMFLAILVLNVAHPGRALIGEDSDFPKKPSRKERKAAKEEKKALKKAEKDDVNRMKAEAKHDTYHQGADAV